MLAITETRNKKVYLVLSDTDFFEPRTIDSYYLTNADPDTVPTGTRLTKWNEIYIAYLYGKEIPIALINPLPEFTEFISLKKPRGKYKWNSGEWKRIH
jgi:hypothetical protein